MAFHGDHRPASVYVDGQVISEPAESTKSGASVEFEGTYNDAAEVSVDGKSMQDGTPTPDAPVPIESIKSVKLVSRNADGIKSATRTIDLQGHELRSLPDGTHDELVVHRDGTVELVQRVVVADENSQYEDVGSVNANGIAFVAFVTNNAAWDIHMASEKMMSNIGVQPYLLSESKSAGFTYNGLRVFYRWPDTSASIEKAKADMASRGAYAIYPDEHPQTIQLPSIDPLPTYYKYTFVDGNGADISARVRVF